MNSRQLVLPHLVLSRRIRKTPFEQRVFENGATAFTTYNHMPLASYYVSAEEDYVHLCEHVQIWDVSCERQVEVTGPDAVKLIELVTPRDISKCQIGQCMYTPLVDEQGWYRKRSHHSSFGSRSVLGFHSGIQAYCYG